MVAALSTVLVSHLNRCVTCGVLSHLVYLLDNAASVLLGDESTAAHTTLCINMPMTYAFVLLSCILNTASCLFAN